MVERIIFDIFTDLLPGIETYLSQVLAQETLSAAAEKRRLYFIERLDVLKLPPSLPPRPEGLVKPGGDIVNGVDTKNLHCQNRHNDVDGVYDTVDGSPGGDSGDITMCDVTRGEDFYEIPQLNDSADPGGQFSDDFSSTSYESYDDEEDKSQKKKRGHLSDIKLPSSKVKKKTHKRLSSGPAARDLDHVTYSGDILQRGRLAWKRRHGVIRDHKLLVYKTDRDTKPVLDLPLWGYDVSYVEREGKRSHVIKVSHAGCDTHYFSAERKETVRDWLEHLNGAAMTLEQHTALNGEANEVAGSMTENNRSSISSSEQSSGDGIVTSSIEATKQNGDYKSLERKSLSRHISETFQNLFTSKRKIDKTHRGSRVLTQEELEQLGTGITVAGQLNICFPSTGKKWFRKWCQIRDNCLEIMTELDEPSESRLPLVGLQVDSAKDDTSKDLALKLVEIDVDKLYIQAETVLEHDSWLTAIVRATEVGERSHNSADITDGLTFDPDEIYDEVYQHLETDSTDLFGFVQRSNSLPKRATPVPDPVFQPPDSDVTLLADVTQYDDVYISPVGGRGDARRQSSRSFGGGRSDGQDALTAFSDLKARLSRQRGDPVQNGGDDVTRSGVVRCASGSTISEDADVLAATSNPILHELRRERSRRGYSEQDKKKVENDLCDLEGTLRKLKRQRTEVRGKKLSAVTSADQTKYTNELTLLDVDMEQLETEVTKLRIKQSEMSCLKDKDDSRRSSCSSSSSRVSSILSSPTTSRRTHKAPLETESRTTGHTGSAGRPAPVTRSDSPSSQRNGRTATNSSLSTGYTALGLDSDDSVARIKQRLRRERMEARAKIADDRIEVVKRPTTLVTSHSDVDVKTAVKIGDEVSPRGGRGKVQYKLKQWEELTNERTSSDC